MDAADSITGRLPINWSGIARNFAGVFIASAFGAESIGHDKKSFGISPLISKRLVQERNYLGRYKKYQLESCGHTVRDRQRQLFKSGVITATLETINHYCAAHSVSPRHPYMDIRLIDYMLRIPDSQSLNGGWTRAIMRKSMEGVVPNEIRWRKDKASQYYSTIKQVVEREELIKDILDNPGLLSHFVNMEELNRLGHHVCDVNKKGVWHLKHVASLILWVNLAWVNAPKDHSLSSEGWQFD